MLLSLMLPPTGLRSSPGRFVRLHQL